MLKIKALIASCGECDFRAEQTCGKTGENVYDLAQIAPFCPLSEYPARRIARMDATIRALRQPLESELLVSILSHIASVFTVTLDTDLHGIVIPLKDGTSVHLRSSSITKMEVTHGIVLLYFDYAEKEYRLEADKKPVLQLHAPLPGIEGLHWMEV